MLTRISQQLCALCAGLVLCSPAPAAVYEINHAFSREPLSLNTDAFRGDAAWFPYGTFNSRGLWPVLAYELENGDSGADISIRGAIELAHALGIRKTHSPDEPGALVWNDLGFDLASRAGSKNNQNEANEAGAIAAESNPGVWALLLIGIGLVGNQLRRKSRVRLIRFASN